MIFFKLSLYISILHQVRHDILESFSKIVKKSCICDPEAIRWRCLRVRILLYVSVPTKKLTEIVCHSQIVGVVISCQNVILNKLRYREFILMQCCTCIVKSLDFDRLLA